MSKEKNYTDNQVKWLKKYADAEIKSIRSAVGIVDKTSILKFEAQNEWRGQMKDQVSTYAIKESTDRRFDDLNNKITELQKFNSNLVGKISLAGVIWTLLIMILTWLITKK